MKNIIHVPLFAILALIIFFSNSIAQETVTLTVTGQGTTQQEARDNALRSAIEQAFGVFISSNTEIVNDELTRDEIVSVSSGNIQNFVILFEKEIEKNNYINTLQVTVSIQNLTTYAENKGVEIKVKGGLFAANIRQQELNEKNEIKAIENTLFILKDILLKSFDADLTLESPIQGTEGKWKLPIEITIKYNDNYNVAWEYLTNTLIDLSMSFEEKISYADAGKPFFPLEVENQTLYLRSLKTITTLISSYSIFIYNSTFNFIVKSNNDLILLERPPAGTGGVEDYFGDIRPLDPREFIYINDETTKAIRPNITTNFEPIKESRYDTYVGVVARAFDQGTLSENNLGIRVAPFTQSMRDYLGKDPNYFKQMRMEELRNNSSLDQDIYDYLDMEWNNIIKNWNNFTKQAVDYRMSDDFVYRTLAPMARSHGYIMSSIYNFHEDYSTDMDNQISEQMIESLLNQGFTIDEAYRVLGSNRADHLPINTIAIVDLTLDNIDLTTLEKISTIEIQKK